MAKESLWEVPINRLKERFINAHLPQPSASSTPKRHQRPRRKVKFGIGFRRSREPSPIASRNPSLSVEFMVSLNP